MSVELLMLLYSALLFLVIILVQAGLGISQNGLMAQAGNRDNLPEPTVLRQRLQRLSANMQENLVMFAVVVLVASAAGVSNDATVLGASVFFYARVAHAIIYAFGWPVIRPLFYFAGLYGIVVIAVQVIKMA
ncbi:MAG: MAPEG family protein [Pseudomonadales bacterium]|nr:MAPEG family protein [Halieaceae bacterium]MCP5124011.1 MAPEG family protein [Pseudomonadales bacterium]